MITESVVTNDSHSGDTRSKKERTMKTNRFTLVVVSFVLFVSMACSIFQAQPTPTRTPTTCTCPTQPSTTEEQGFTPTPCMCLSGQPAITQVSTKTDLLGGCSEADLVSVETKKYVSVVMEELSNTDPTKITPFLSEIQSAYDNLPVCVRNYIEPYNTALALGITTAQQVYGETDPAKLQTYKDALTAAMKVIGDNSPLFANLKAASEGSGLQAGGSGSTLKILDPKSINSLGACYSAGRSDLTAKQKSVVYTRSLMAAGGSPFKGYTWSAKNLPMGTTIWPQTGVFTSNGGALNPDMPEMMVEVTVSDGTSSVSAMIPFGMGINTDKIGCPSQVDMGLIGVPGTALEDAVANKPYGASLGVSGGTPPYSWVEDTSFSGRGDFDLSGLTIDMSSGVVRGTPFNSASGKTLRFRVIVKDSLGGTTSGAGAIFTITVH